MRTPGKPGFGHELHVPFEFFGAGAGVREVEAPAAGGLVAALHGFRARRDPAPERLEVIGQVLVVLHQVAAAAGERFADRSQFGDARALRLERGRQERPSQHPAQPPYSFHAVVGTGEGLEQRPRRPQLHEPHSPVHGGIADGDRQQAEEIRQPAPPRS